MLWIYIEIVYQCINLLIITNITYIKSLLDLKLKRIFRDLSNYSLMGVFQKYKTHLWHLKGIEVPYVNLYVNFRVSNNICVIDRQ